MKERLKAFASTKLGIGVLAFIAGCLVSIVLFPETIKVLKEKQVVEKEKIVYVNRDVVKIQYRDRVVEKKVRVVKTKITFPDGKIVETEVYESQAQQVDRMRQTYEEQYKQQLVQKEQELKEKYEMSHTNPKRFSIMAGAGSYLDDYKDYYYIGSVQYNIGGPFVLGAHVTSKKQVGLSFGIQF